MSLRCVVTGATGFVGSKLCAHLLREGFEVHALVRESSNLSLLEEILPRLRVHKIPPDGSGLGGLFSEIKANVVFHLAAMVQNVQHAAEDIIPLIESNVFFGTKILEAMRTSKTRHLVNTGTHWQHYQGEAYCPLNLYAATKQAFEDIATYYTEVVGVKMITLHLFDVFAEDDPRPKLYSLLRLCAETGDVLKLSPGDQLLDLVEVKDVCKAYTKAAMRLLAGNMEGASEIYGVSGGNPRTLRQIVLDYERDHAVSLNVEWGGRPYREREMFSLWKDYKLLPKADCLNNSKFLGDE